MNNQQLIPHLFRQEFSKITAVLCKQFGIENIAIAEDIASETFLAALETWPYKGAPANPTAWLYYVAKNKARNYGQRLKIFVEKVKPALGTAPDNDNWEIDLSEENILDSQLQMLFAVCTPLISPEAQIALSLRLLCGFGIEEIADALLTSKETINKRLVRAREKLRTEKIALEIPPAGELGKRLTVVLTTMYLLFNEGYYSESNNAVLRKDLCFEAMRLTNYLMEYDATNTPAVSALFALMCFHASRFGARKNASGQMILYPDQDDNLWNQELISKGAFYLQESARGNQLSKYHLEASIAYWHTIKKDTLEKWENILHLFDLLLTIEYSPVAALNRIYAFSKVKGKEAAIEPAEALGLAGNPYYHSLMGELYLTVDDVKARQSFETAWLLAKTEADKNILSQKIQRL